MTEQGRLHADTKSGDYSKFPSEEAVRECFVNTKDRYQDKEAYGDIHVSAVQILKEHRYLPIVLSFMIIIR